MFNYTCNCSCGTAVVSGNRQRHPALKAAGSSPSQEVPCATIFHAPCRQKQMRKSSCLRYGCQWSWRKPHLNDPKRIFSIRSLHLYTQTSLKGTQIALNRADSVWPCIAWYYMRCMFRECSQNCLLDYEQIIATLYSLTALHILHEQRALIMKHMISTIWAVFISPVAEWLYGSIWDYIFTKYIGCYIYIYI